MKKVAIFLLLIISVFVAMGFMAPVFAGTRPNYVYDNADLLTSEEEQIIHDLCYAHDLNTTNEVVVYTMENLDKYDGDMDLARNTIFNDVPLDGVEGIGKSGKDNGVLLVVAKEDSRWGIETGYGMEGDLTDGECGRIGRALKPELQDGNYTAIITAVEKIIDELGGGSGEKGLTEEQELIICIVIALIVIGIVVFLAFFIFSNGGGGGGGWSGGSYGGGGGGGFGGGGSGGGGASGVTKNPQLPPPKPRYRYHTCPSCGTKKRCQLDHEYRSELTEGNWIYSILLTYVVCLTCQTFFHYKKKLRRIETLKQRQARKAGEAAEARRRRARRRQEEEEEREDEDDDWDSPSSSYSSGEGGFGGGGFGGGGFGGGGSGGGGASG